MQTTTAENWMQQPHAHWTRTCYPHATKTTKHRLTLFKRWIAPLRSHWLALNKSTALFTSLSVGRPTCGTRYGSRRLIGQEVMLAGWSSVREPKSVPTVDWWADGDQKSSSFLLQPRWTASPSQNLRTTERTDRQIWILFLLSLDCFFCFYKFRSLHSSSYSVDSGVLSPISKQINNKKTQNNKDKCTETRITH